MPRAHRTTVRHLRLALLTAAGLATTTLAQPQPAQPPGLPIRSITLYRSGVGFFERRGMVQGQDQVQLRFATDQINDILKSMVILIDPQHGRVASVGYGSKDPLARRLSSFGVDISDNPDLAKLLARLRGAPIRIVAQDGPISGTILGVETRPTPTGKDNQVVQDPFVTLVTESGIRAVDLSQIASFDILDKSLAAELSKALAALAEHRADRVKTVDVAFDTADATEAVVAYIHEMPVWKTSYRLVLPDQPEGRKSNTEQGGQPTIQGWAIVENTTDEDWDNVRLGLVAGRPVSFQMDLYEPLHVERPEIPVPMVPGVRPREYAESSTFAAKRDLEAAAEAPRVDVERSLLKSQGGGGGGGQSPFRDESRGYAYARKPQDSALLTADGLINYSAQSQAGTAEIGEVFQYQLKSPISIARQRSAMLPILSSAISGRRVSIFSRADGGEHPMRGVELKNSTGMQLMPGPISVFDGAAYAGDAQIGHVTLNDKRLLAYAVDLDIQTVVKDDSTSDVRHIRIVSGLVEETIKQVQKTSYAFANKDAKRPRALLVEHPKNMGWDLVEPKKAAEETPALERFELALPPSESARLDVVHEHTELQTIAVTGFDLPTLVAFAKDGKASKAVVEAVRKAADMQSAINDTKRRVALLDQERQAIDQDQARIRQNMPQLARDSELYRRYTTKLNEQESRLESLRQDRDKEQSTLTKQQQDLDAYIRGLNVE